MPNPTPPRVFFLFFGSAGERCGWSSWHDHEYRVALRSDGSTCGSMKLSLASYIADENAGICAWVQLEIDEESRVREV